MGFASNTKPALLPTTALTKWISRFLRPVNGLTPTQFIQSLLLNPNYGVHLASILILGEIVLSLLIIRRVPYTEIDWKAYMQEVGGFLSGETDYMNLRGDTGPLVYPAGFVYVYSVFYKLLDAGKNILAAQYIFGGLYVLQQAIVFAIYIRARLPPYLMIFLIMSKRIHSISLLRLFNDPIAMLPLYASILVFTYGRYRLASLLYSLALSIKMNILLPLPAFALLTLSRTSLKTSLQCLFIILTTQITLSMPFTLTHPTSYISRAFEFSRVFMYKWSVNWKFVPEDAFLSSGWARGLLLMHVGLLLAFAFGRWNSVGIVKKVLSEMVGLNNNEAATTLDQNVQNYLTARLTLEYTSIATLIGITFARSLHYQFYSWYFHFLPYLLYRAQLSLWMKMMIFGAIEFAWNKYPATPISSGVLLAAHVVLLGKLWFETRQNTEVRKLTR